MPPPWVTINYNYLCLPTCFYFLCKQFKFISILTLSCSSNINEWYDNIQDKKFHLCVSAMDIELVKIISMSSIILMIFHCGHENII